MEFAPGWDIWAAMAAVFVAGVVRGFSGFGAAMIMVPLLSILYGPVQAVPIAITLAFFSTVQLLPGALRATRWGLVVPLSISALAFIPAGSLALAVMDPLWMRRAISALVAAFALVLLTGWRWRGEPRTAGALLAGGLAGLINGAAGTGGPPVILYLLGGPAGAEANRANIISFYAVMNLGTLAALAAHGLITRETLGLVGWLLPSFVLSLWVGARMFKRSGEAAYRRVALLLLLGVGLFGMVYR